MKMDQGRENAKRLWSVTTLFIILFILIVAQLFHIQIIRHKDFLERGEDQWGDFVVLPADRGSILDRNGKVLAKTVTTWKLGIATVMVKDPALLVQSLASLIEVPNNFEQQIINSKPKHIVFNRSAVLHSDTVAKLQNIPELTMEEKRSRLYPYGAVAASLLGFSQQDSDGAYHNAGIESSMNQFLAGTSGKGLRTVAMKGSKYDEIISMPINGHDVTLSIDINLQTICENYLNKSIKKCSAQNGSVIVLDAKSGNILAAADSPVVINRSDCPDSLDLWNNYNFMGAYEPGSVFKVFTLASLLNRGAITTETKYDCDNTNFGQFNIRNSSGHDDFGILPLIDAFALSSNVYFSRSVGNLSKQEFYSDIRSFGFGLPVSIEYSGSASGSLKEPGGWSGRSKPSIAIGQELLVSPLQIVTAATMLANDGYIVRPRLIKKIGNILSPASPSRNVIPKDNVKVIIDAMTAAVDHGTGKKAAVSWTSVAGKTGTAQIIVDGKYSQTEFLASFLGLVPAENPKIIILTILDKPDKRFHYASMSAAPLFADIVNEMCRTTDLFDQVIIDNRESTENLTKVPDLSYMTSASACNLIESSKLVSEKQPAPGLVIDQYPKPGSIVLKGTTVSITVASEETGNGLIIANLKEMSNREVQKYANSLQLKAVIHGTGYVVKQSPQMGSPVVDGVVEVWMENRW